jgi:channel protein (hemolysin III family)
MTRKKSVQSSVDSSLVFKFVIRLAILTSDIPHIDVVPWLGIREPFSSLSHLLGAIVFTCLSIGFVRRGRGNVIHEGSLFILAISSVLLLLASGIYHVFWPGPIREILLRIDVAGVFVLIAASMTPVHAILYAGLARWLPLILIWTVAITGIVWRTLFCQSTPGPEGIAFFLLFGWCGVVTTFFLVRRFGWNFVHHAALSGVSYTIGAIGLMLHRPILIPGVIGPHEIWHVAVLIGIAFQWRFVSQFAVGYASAYPHTAAPKNQRENLSKQTIINR